MYEMASLYPSTVTLSNLYYFMLTPTLCYEFRFPRTYRIRKHFLAKRLFEVFPFLISACLLIEMKRIAGSLPVLPDGLPPAAVDYSHSAQQHGSPQRNGIWQVCLLTLLVCLCIADKLLLFAGSWRDSSNWPCPTFSSGSSSSTRSSTRHSISSPNCSVLPIENSTGEKWSSLTFRQIIQNTFK